MRTPDKAVGDYELHDSGSRETFASGAQRDPGKDKGRWDLLSLDTLRRDAILLEKGAVKYAARNWEQGMPFSRCISSAIHHIFRHLAGHRDEDHLAAARWNIGCIMHFEAAVAAGRLPPKWNDLPSPLPPETPVGVDGAVDNPVHTLTEAKNLAEALTPTDTPAPGEYAIIKCSVCRREFVASDPDSPCSACAFHRDTEYLVRKETPNA